MLTADQRYWQAITKARIQGARGVRHMMEGKTPFAECVADLEQAAIIKEIERAMSDDTRDRQNELFQLRAALEASVKLQSHYAGLLNQYDGGQRLQFSSSEEWLERLAALAQIQEAGQ